MAYVDFRSLDAGTQHAAFAPARAPAAAPEAALSALEWSVVVIARNDRLSTLREPGRIAMALGTVFGGRPSPALADPKLEALRRTAVLSWNYGYAIPSADLHAFKSAGFSADQYELMLASISAARIQRGKRA